MYSSNDNKKTNGMASERLNKLHDHLVNAQNGQCSFHREFERHGLGLEAIENAFAGRVDNSFALHRTGTLRANDDGRPAIVFSCTSTQYLSC